MVKSGGNEGKWSFFCPDWYINPWWIDDHPLSPEHQWLEDEKKKNVSENTYFQGASCWVFGVSATS